MPGPLPPTSATPFAPLTPPQNYTLDSVPLQNTPRKNGRSTDMGELEAQQTEAVAAKARRQRGVAKVEAAQGVWGKKSKWWLYLG